MIIARKIAYNVLVSSVSKIISTVLALISIGFITRYLGKNGFGDYATVLAFFAFFSAMADLGLYSISTREISRPGADTERIMGNIFSLRIISSLIICLVSPLIVWFLPYSKELKEGIIIVAAAYLFSSAYQVLNGVFQKHLAMDRVAISELIGKVVQLGSIILAVKLGLSFSWIIASLLAYMIVSFTLVFLWSRSYLRLKLHFDTGYWRKFLKESYPLGISAVITFAYFKLDTILLSLMRSSADVGIYNAAYKVIENITFFPSMIVGLMFPIMSGYIVSDRAKFKDISNKTFKVFILLVTPLVIGTLYLAPGIIQLIGGAGFSESAAVLRILVFALAFIFFGNFFNAVLISGGKQKQLMFVLGLAAVLNISLNLAAIPRFSYFGAATTSVFTEIFVVAVTAILVAKKLRYIPFVEKGFSIAISGAIMALAMFFIREHNLFFVGFFGVAVYAAGLWILGAVKTEDVASIISRKGVEKYEAIP